jgi:hypothetical protein
VAAAGQTKSDSGKRVYFVRIHQTLKMTPAMAAGITKRLWEIADIVDVLEACGREVLRVDQSKPEAGKGFRSLNRLGEGLPLRRLCHAPRSSYRQAGMNFETDS